MCRTAGVVAANVAPPYILQPFIRIYVMFACISIFKWRTVTGNRQGKRHAAFCPGRGPGGLCRLLRRFAFGLLRLLGCFIFGLLRLLGRFAFGLLRLLGRFAFGLLDLVLLRLLGGCSHRLHHNGLLFHIPLRKRSGGKHGANHHDG